MFSRTIFFMMIGNIYLFCTKKVTFVILSNWYHWGPNVGKHLDNLYHVLNLQEFCVKKVDRVEVLTMLGLFGMLSSVVEMYPFWLKIGFKFLAYHF